LPGWHLSTLPATACLFTHLLQLYVWILHSMMCNSTATCCNSSLHPSCTHACGSCLCGAAPPRLFSSSNKCRPKGVSCLIACFCCCCCWLQSDLLSLIDSSGNGIRTSVQRSWDSTAVQLSLRGTWSATPQARKMAMLAVYQVSSGFRWMGLGRCVLVDGDACSVTGQSWAVTMCGHTPTTV
jgi:hypothetical protein